MPDGPPSADPARSSVAEVDRVQREREWHDHRFSGEDSRVGAEKYYAGTGSSERAYRALIAGEGRRVLEYGCGVGSSALELAQRDEVVGIDVSAVAVAQARAEASSRGVTRAAFAQMDAERTSFASGVFDLVAGKGILHHLDLERAFQEIARVLAPGGRAVFREPLGSNPLISLYRRLTPSMRTADEHPLAWSDFDLARRWFERVDVSVFHCLSIAATPVRSVPGGARLSDALDRFDSWMFRRVPATRKLAWIVVVELSGPRGV